MTRMWNDELRSQIRLRGLSVKAFSVQVGASYPAAMGWVRGKHTPSWAFRTKLAEAGYHLEYPNQLWSCHGLLELYRTEIVEKYGKKKTRELFHAMKVPVKYRKDLCQIAHCVDEELDESIPSVYQLCSERSVDPWEYLRIHEVVEITSDIADDVEKFKLLFHPDEQYCVQAQGIGGLYLNRLRRECLCAYYAMFGFSREGLYDLGRRLKYTPQRILQLIETSLALVYPTVKRVLGVEACDLFYARIKRLNALRRDVSAYTHTMRVGLSSNPVARARQKERIRVVELAYPGIRRENVSFE